MYKIYNDQVRGIEAGDTILIFVNINILNLVVLKLFKFCLNRYFLIFTKK